MLFGNFIVNSRLEISYYFILNIAVRWLYQTQKCPQFNQRLCLARSLLMSNDSSWRRAYGVVFLQDWESRARKDLQWVMERQSTGKEKVRKGERQRTWLFLLLGNPHQGAGSVTDRSARQQNQKEKAFCLETTALNHVPWLSLHIGRQSFFFTFSLC